MEASGQLQALAAWPQARNHGTHSLGGWVGSRAGLDLLGEYKNQFLQPEFQHKIVQAVACSLLSKMLKQVIPVI